MGDVSTLRPQPVRTVWISDVHLGFRGCSADLLLDFLDSVECGTLYLVGDIADVWSMRRGIHWPQAHNNLIRTILGKAKHGIHVVFVPGDEFDSVVTCHPWLARLGNHAYDWLLTGNRWVNLVRRRFGMRDWSLAGFLERKVKNAVNYISGFEEAVARAASRRGVDGVVCGHIHHAEIREIDGIGDHNCGDRVESHTALVERFDGAIELLHWSDLSATEHGVPAPEAAAALRQAG